MRSSSTGYVRRNAPTSRCKRRGQALIEAAFIMPILLLFMLSIVQFGLVYNAKLALEHACRESARYAAVYARQRVMGTSSPDADIKAKAVRVANAMGVPLAATDITVGPLIQNTALTANNRPLYSPITVTITYNMNSRRIIPAKFYMPVGGTMIILPIFADSYVVSQTVIMEGQDVP